MAAKHEGYILNDFRTVVLHPILPSRELIEDCGIGPCIGLSRSVRTPETEEYLLDRFQETPSTSSRAGAAEISVSPATVWRVLRKKHIQPFRLQRVQCLKDDDYSHRLHFVRRMLQSITKNPQFLN